MHLQVRHRSSGAAKRLCDLVGATLLSLLLAPFIGIAALLVVAALGRPVFFRQVRTGIHGRAFALYKFRTMRPLGGAPGSQDDDGRLTRVGRFLRATSLDELPELWNVVRGDMSLVGPRPLLPEYLPLYSPFEARRHHVKPGITGWAQINGRNATTWEERFRFDVWYVENQSLGLDLRIFLRTVVAVMTRRGISHPDHSTMERFDARKG